MSEIKPDSKLSDNIQYIERKTLNSIEHDLMAINQDTTHLIGANSAGEVEHASKISRLYRLAALIYFERVMKQCSTGGRVSRWSAEAFDIIQKLDICERPFPLFFVGCEAQNDTQREMILRLLERTQKMTSQRRLYAVQGMIESMWVQFDLSSDQGGTSYLDVLNTVMSSNELLPTLA
jgi:hypothetical protein